MSASYTNLKAGISSDSYKPTTRLDAATDLDFGERVHGTSDEEGAFLGTLDDPGENDEASAGDEGSLKTMEVETGTRGSERGTGCACVPSFLSVDFYQPYFEVNTEDVKRRIFWPLPFRHSLDGYDTFLSLELRGELILQAARTVLAGAPEW